jgi:hypothetical protein
MATYIHTGMTAIFWGLVNNRCLRVLKINGCNAGPRFGSAEDALPVNGICLPRMILNNIILRDLDLSYNNLSSETGNLLLDAMTVSIYVYIYIYIHTYIHTYSVFEFKREDVL